MLLLQPRQLTAKWLQIASLLSQDGWGREGSWPAKDLPQTHVGDVFLPAVVSKLKIKQKLNISGDLSFLKGTFSTDGQDMSSSDWTSLSRRPLWTLSVTVMVSYTWPSKWHSLDTPTRLPGGGVGSPGVNWYKVDSSQYICPTHIDSTHERLTAMIKETCKHIQKSNGISVTVRKRAGLALRIDAEYDPPQTKGLPQAQLTLLCTRKAKHMWYDLCWVHV